MSLAFRGDGAGRPAGTASVRPTTGPRAPSAAPRRSSRRAPAAAPRRSAHGRVRAARRRVRRSRRRRRRRDPRPRVRRGSAGLAHGGRPGGGREHRLHRSRHSLAGSGPRLVATPGHVSGCAARRRRPRWCSGARGTTGRSRSAGRWSGCATPKASGTWRGSCAIPTTSSTCSTCSPVTRGARMTRRARMSSSRRQRTPARSGPRRQARLPRANRRTGGRDRAGAPLERPRAGRAREGELDALTRQLAVALGLGGRDRRAASDSERARVSVSKAVHSAVRRLDDQHPDSAGTSRSPCIRARSARMPLTRWRRSTGTPDVTAVNPDLTPTGYASKKISRALFFLKNIFTVTRCSSSTSRTPRHSSVHRATRVPSQGSTFWPSRGVPEAPGPVSRRGCTRPRLRYGRRDPRDRRARGIRRHGHGIDQSPEFIVAAERLAADEGSATASSSPSATRTSSTWRTRLRCGRGPHPRQPCARPARGARRGRPRDPPRRLVAIFDGDYASLTFGTSDARHGQAMEAHCNRSS